MHQTILMHADIHECAERGHVGDHAFEDHAGLQVLQFFHSFAKTGGGKFGTRIAAGFFQFFEDVGDGRDAELLIQIFCRAKRIQQTAVADDAFDVLLDVGQDALHQRIRFGVNSRSIERIIAAHDAQKARRLFECLLTQTWHVA